MKFSLVFLLASVTTLVAQSGEKLVASARKQVGVTQYYDPIYRTLDFPNGDVPADRGVCKDVIIRAMRNALAKDLQLLLNQDMKANFSAYPKNWGLSETDRNIDHRRVPNLKTYFKRKGYDLPLEKEKDPAKFQPGDIVTCTVPPNLPHIMLVSDQKTDAGVPLVGTWRSSDPYYLRIYPDYRVAQWPSPSEGNVSWSRHSGGELLWGRIPPYERNPRVERSGDALVMKSDTSTIVLNRVIPDLEPGRRAPDWAGSKLHDCHWYDLIEILHQS